ncbi:hypothetical protein [Nonomuraea sp. NPDC049480]|uniref:hypothetical protein n=1 Tax=Nonomuraea sp. NPDC049480 TaxID=3364353 RepID=UPI00379C62BE
MAAESSGQVAWIAALEIGLLAGIGFVLVLGLIRWVEHPTTDATARSPRSTWRADRNLIVIRIVSGILVGIMGGAIVWHAKLPADGPFPPELMDGAPRVRAQPAPAP